MVVFGFSVWFHHHPPLTPHQPRFPPPPLHRDNSSRAEAEAWRSPPTTRGHSAAQPQHGTAGGGFTLGVMIPRFFGGNAAGN